MIFQPQLEYSCEKWNSKHSLLLTLIVIYSKLFQTALFNGLFEFSFFCHKESLINFHQRIKFIKTWSLIPILCLICLFSFPRIRDSIGEHICVKMHEMSGSQYENKFFQRFYCTSSIYGVFLGCVSEKIDQGRSYEYKSVDISFCSFSRLSQYSGKGGVICLDGLSYNMNVLFSMFYNCIANIGGAIYFEAANSVLKNICANKCSASESHFSYLQASQNNKVEYLSMSLCSHTTSGFHPLFIRKGNQVFDNTNSSMNYAIFYSGLYVWNPVSFAGSYNSFSNNRVTHSVCI